MLFLYTSLPWLHDYDMKFPKRLFMEDLNQDDKFLFLPLNLGEVPKNSILRKFTYIRYFTRVGITATKFEKKAKSL